MKVLDPGHTYLLSCIDGDEERILQYVKREGPGYPGNSGQYPGTIIQDVIRTCIDRLKYVDKQIPHTVNKQAIKHLRMVLGILEYRAAERHNRVLYLTDEEWRTIEVLPVGKNGHLLKGAGD